MNFDQMMAELRAEYIASIPQKIKDIQAHLNASDVGLLRDDFHKLKGTGKTYGIPEISDVGAAVEKICTTKKENATLAVQKALIVLQGIHDSRNQNKPYDLSSCAEMKFILTL